MPSTQRQAHTRRNSSKAKHAPLFDRSNSELNPSAKPVPPSKRRASLTGLDETRVPFVQFPPARNFALQLQDTDNDRPYTYSSLPPSPIPGSPQHSHPTALPKTSSSQPLSSLWDYLREELLATDLESHQDLKWERVSNFLSVPLVIEKVRSS